MTLRLREFRAEGFRSLRSIAYPVSDLDVFVGANGVGKTNLYRALELVQAAARNALAQDLMRDGGITSALWTGPRRRGEPVRLRLSVGLANPDQPTNLLRYEVEVGMRPPASAAFEHEPQVKAEAVSYTTRQRTVRLIERSGASVTARGQAGRRVQLDLDLLPSETLLGRLEQPDLYPELDRVRRTLLQWRFYHGLRTDPGSPLRRPCPAVATPTLASDGSDLAAVFATLAHIRGDTTELDAAIGAAFPGAALTVPEPGRSASFSMTFPEFPKRAFEAQELSDGTLRFLTLAGALLAYRLPPFVALNEPESSLHEDLMEPLAGLIVDATQRTQVWLVTHSSRLAEAIRKKGAGRIRTVRKVDGATAIDGLKLWGAFEGEEE